MENIDTQDEQEMQHIKIRIAELEAQLADLSQLAVQLAVLTYRYGARRLRKEIKKAMIRMQER